MNNVYAIGSDPGIDATLGQFSGNWREDYVGSSQPVTDLLALLRYYKIGSLWPVASSSAAAFVWEYKRILDVTTSQTSKRGLLISQLGWSLEEALETRMRLRTFEEDWNADGMEAYDEL